MSDGPTPAPLTAGAWWVCGVTAGSGARPHRIVVVESHTYPDGTRVDLAEEIAAAQIGDDTLCAAELDEAGEVVSLQVSRRYAPKAPPLFFVEVRESNVEPPAVNLAAFTGDQAPGGALLAEADFANLDVDGDDQVGGVRWIPSTGRSDQLYVQPQWRRRNIASALLAAAETVSVARAWPRLWGDGQRTELGEQARNARTWAGRTADLTHLHPPNDGS